jgi:hypothetical protein
MPETITTKNSLYRAVVLFVPFVANFGSDPMTIIVAFPGLLLRFNRALKLANAFGVSFRSQLRHS